MGQLGATWVRTFLRWDQVEPGGPGRWDPTALAGLEQYTALAQLKGIKVVAVVTGAPQWANGSTRPLRPAARPSRTSRASSARSPRVSAARSPPGRSGTSRTSTSSGTGRSAPQQYAPLLTAAHTAIQRGRPVGARARGRIDRQRLPVPRRPLRGRCRQLVRRRRRAHRHRLPDHARPTATTARPTAASGASASSASARSTRCSSSNGNAERPIIMTELGWSATKTRCSRGASAGKKAAGVTRGPAGRLPQARLPLPQLLPVREGRALVQPDRHGSAGHRADPLRPAALRRLAGARRSTRSRRSVTATSAATAAATSRRPTCR